MKFRLVLKQKFGSHIPFNYQYSLSSAIYNILKTADAEYASQVHNKGYGKGFKFFTFSDLNFREFKFSEGYILLNAGDIVSLYVDIHIPKAYRSFMKGIFENKTLVIADKNVKATFDIVAVEVVETPISTKKDNEMVKILVAPTSAMCVGRKNERGNYDYLSPKDDAFSQYLLSNWKEKVKALYPNEPEELMMVTVQDTADLKSRLVALKSGTPQETKIKGYRNFTLEIIGKKRDVELLIHGGLGLHNAQGMGSVKVLSN